MIREFQGDYRFLSNFIGGVEQRYQAAKCVEDVDRFKILRMSPGDAKRYAKTVKIRPDWNQIKLELMEKFVRDKFQKEPFRSRLIATGDEILQEGNYWSDTFWGVDLRTGRGENHLGKIIMNVRKELKNGGSK